MTKGAHHSVKGIVLVMGMALSLLVSPPLLQPGMSGQRDCGRGASGRVIKATIVAQPGRPTRGTEKRDVIAGTQGNDIIKGGDGDDVICGKGGDDRISGGAGKDHLSGDEGNDRIAGDAGGDVLGGDFGDDELTGGADNDLLYGEEGNDHVIGGDGADYLSGNVGDDHLDGGPGQDRIVGQEGNDSLDAGALGPDDLPGDNKGDVLFGDGGDDIIIGNDDRQLVHAGDGADHIEGRGDDDELYGGDGYSCENCSSESDIGDSISGGGGDDEIRAEGGDDDVDGGPGNDAIQGESGTDSLTGGDGDDVITDDYDGVLDGGNGSDELLASARARCVNGEYLEGCDEIEGGDWVDLSTWARQGQPNYGSWEVDNAGNGIWAWTRNAPTFWIGPDSYGSVKLTGWLDAHFATGDGYMGLLLGYNTPGGDSCASNTCNIDAVLVDWGAAGDQERGDVIGVDGFSIARIQGSVDLTDPAGTFWSHNDDPAAGFDVLATDHALGNSWSRWFGRSGPARFEITYTPTSITVVIDEKTVLSAEGTFPPGKIGLYGYGAYPHFAGIYPSF